MYYVLHLKGSNERKYAFTCVKIHDRSFTRSVIEGYKWLLTIVPYLLYCKKFIFNGNRYSILGNILRRLEVFL